VHEYAEGLQILDTATRKLTLDQALTGRPHQMSFSQDGRVLAAALDDRIVLLELASGNVRLTFRAKARALTFSADGRFLVTALADTTAVIWDLAQLADAPKEGVPEGR
jgi:WD40 repeat protein